MEREAARLRQIWVAMFKELGTPVPSLTQFYVWLTKYPPRVVEKAIHSTLRKAFNIQQHGEEMAFSHQVNYCGKVMKMVTQEEIEREMSGVQDAPTVRRNAPQRLVIENPPVSKGVK